MTVRRTRRTFRESAMMLPKDRGREGEGDRKMSFEKEDLKLLWGQ